MGDTFQFDQILLVWDDFHWCGNVDIPLFGRASNQDVEFSVNTEDEEQIEPRDQQLEAWRRFVEREELIFLAILEAGFSYYTRMRPQFAQLGEEWVKNMPEITNADTLDEMICLSSVIIT